MSRLQGFPVDTLKIDRAFVSKLGHDEETEEIVRTILTLAHNLGMKVVAEGTETAAQIKLLTELNCEMAQGYFLPDRDAEAIHHILATTLSKPWLSVGAEA